MSECLWKGRFEVETPFSHGPTSRMCLLAVCTVYRHLFYSYLWLRATNGCPCQGCTMENTWLAGILGGWTLWGDAERLCTAKAWGLGRLWSNVLWGRVSCQYVSQSHCRPRSAITPPYHMRAVCLPHSPASQDTTERTQPLAPPHTVCTSGLSIPVPGLSVLIEDEAPCMF